MQFKDITGHRESIEKLIHSAQTGRISHAQLFLGGEGSGNLALAIAYIQYILCTDRTPEDSCGTCPACLKVSKLAHPDVHFAFPVVNQGENTQSKDSMERFRQAVLQDPYISLEEWTAYVSDENKNLGIYAGQCHEIIKDLSLKSFESPFKFLVMWLPEKLYTGVGNKLLKIIEEPPTKTVFLLVSHNDEQILPTIRSRTQLVKLKKINDFDMLDALTNRYQLPLERAREIVNIADGNFHAAKQLAELEEINEDHFNFITNWLRNSYTGDYHLLMQSSDEFSSYSRQQQKSLLEYALFIVRESVAFNWEPSLMRVTGKENEFLSKFARFIGPETAPQISAMLEESIYHVERNAHPKILLTNLSIRIQSLINPK